MNNSGADISSMRLVSIWTNDGDCMGQTIWFILSEFNVAGEIALRLVAISGDGQRLITRSNNLVTIIMTTIHKNKNI